MSMPRRTRIITSSRVIRQLWINEDLSRADLAKQLDLNKSSMSNIVQDLIDNKIVIETEEKKAGPKGGRKATGLKLNKDHYYAIGIELRSDSYTVLAIDLEGSVLFSETVSKGFTSKTFSVEVRSLIKQMIEALAWLDRPLIGVGIGFSGVVDSEKQTILSSVSLGFDQPFDFAKHISSYFTFPIILENDANAGAWGEVVFQRKRKLRNFLFVLIEFWKYYSDIDGSPQPTIGIGLGFDGKIYRGTHFKAGEFKSVFNQDTSNSHQVVIEEGICITENKQYLQSYLLEVSRNIAFLVNTLDIGNVFIGGDIEAFKSFMPDMLQTALKENSLQWEENTCQIQFSSLGYHAVSFGAAALVLDKILVDLESLEDSSDNEVYPLFYLNSRTIES
ncbi:MAG: ROK family transcriptional regulator [Spirochaetia bacterium]|nr:ROK family transcriptional regulator [Spirochaetia bacterium]